MSRKVVSLILAAAAAVAAVAVVLWSRREPSAPAPEREAARQKTKLIPEAGRAKTPKRVVREKPKARPDDGMDEADRKISEAVQTALDDENLTGLRDQIAAVRASTNAAVRQAAVEALGWFGTKAMSDIVAFIEDPDEDVRDAARTCWEQVIVEVDEEPVQAAIVEETLLGTRDVDFAETLASHYNGMDEKRAIESILKVISGGTKTAAKAVKEAYEFVTGEEYTTPAAARAWLKENYTPPDKED